MIRAWWVQLWSNLINLLRAPVHSAPSDVQALERQPEEAIQVAQGFMARYRNALRELGR